MTDAELAMLDQIRWERDIAIDQLKQLGYGLGEKIRKSDMPCTDAISREDALMSLTGIWTESRDEILAKAIRRIRKLPSVRPIATDDGIKIKCGGRRVKVVRNEDNSL